jgi:hypothetical protein
MSGVKAQPRALSESEQRLATFAAAADDGATLNLGVGGAGAAGSIIVAGLFTLASLPIGYSSNPVPDPIGNTIALGVIGTFCSSVPLFLSAGVTKLGVEAFQGYCGLPTSSDVTDTYKERFPDAHKKGKRLGIAASVALALAGGIMAFHDDVREMYIINQAAELNQRAEPLIQCSDPRVQVAINSAIATLDRHGARGPFELGCAPKVKQTNERSLREPSNRCSEIWAQIAINQSMAYLSRSVEPSVILTCTPRAP